MSSKKSTGKTYIKTPNYNKYLSTTPKQVSTVAIHSRYGRGTKPQIAKVMAICFASNIAAPLKTKND